MAELSVVDTSDHHPRPRRSKKTRGKPKKGAPKHTGDGKLPPCPDVARLLCEEGADAIAPDEGLLTPGAKKRRYSYLGTDADECHAGEGAEPRAARESPLWNNSVDMRYAHGRGPECAVSPPASTKSTQGDRNGASLNKALQCMQRTVALLMDSTEEGGDIDPSQRYIAEIASNILAKVYHTNTTRPEWFILGASAGMLAYKYVMGDPDESEQHPVSEDIGEMVQAYAAGSTMYMQDATKSINRGEWWLFRKAEYNLLFPTMTGVCEATGVSSILPQGAERSFHDAVDRAYEHRRGAGSLYRQIKEDMRVVAIACVYVSISDTAEAERLSTLASSLLGVEGFSWGGSEEAEVAAADAARFLAARVDDS